MTGRHLLKRSFTLAGHRTSVALETEFWTALEGLAATRGITLSALVQQVDAARTEPDLPLASALRVHALVASRQERSGE
ncbi:ribbon-helix-helix domain-containing protein [Roseomonas sp. E05]|uniref:ribbon-helix-helix domain-containing protein n=1 Tax=Roseomonas sp. E05 TaxID=3046310 RepID=UPI0024BAA063|nr:ribbon-helix-helix domain-containing protein [Roseomonas sp. E05]MDJ0387419.1 ribbon-helix-helix domain-containing protein [Roseomonas sp. E05]